MLEKILKKIEVADDWKQTALKKRMFPSLSEVKLDIFRARCVFFEVPNITTCRVWTSAQTPFWEKVEHGKT